MLSFLVLLTSMVLGIKWQEGALIGAGPRINYTGRQRMLTERMNHFAFSLAFHQARGESEKVQKDLEGLKKTRKTFGEALDVLVGGGEIVLPKGKKQKIDTQYGQGVKKALREGLAVWSDTQPLLDIVVNPSSGLEMKGRALVQLEPKLTKLKQLMNKATYASQEEAQASLHFFAEVVWGGLLLGLALSFFLRGFFKRKILEPLKEIQSFTEKVAAGDVSQELSIQGCDRGTELGQLVQAVNSMGNSLKGLLADVKNTSCELAGAAKEITTTSNRMFQAVEKQAQTTQRVKAAFGEMVHAIDNVASNASEAAGNANQAGKSAKEGGQVVSGTIRGMHNIRDTVVESAGAVKGLGEHSQTIGMVIEVIQDIAEQTNLLALNATIEAARAGENGRGFAVVADEVRQLAERTADATTEIAGAIQSMQNEMDGVVRTMEDGTQTVESGVRQAVDAEQALQEIVGSTDLVAEKIKTIAAATEEQSATVNEISTHVERINEGAEISKSGAEDVLSAAALLSKRADSLNALVANFRT